MQTYEEKLEYNRQYRKKNRPKILIKERKYNLKRKYGIDIDRYNQMFKEQNGCCAICDIHQDELKCALSVDHNHTTGKVRGLLCDKCNLMLGYGNDDIGLLINAIKYLNNSI